MRVNAKTVKNLLAETLKKDLKEEEYYLCLNKSCNVAYYKHSCDQIYLQEDLKVPIWFKEGANPKYICYCSKVTEKEIIEAIVNEGAKTIKDLIEITGAMKNCNCILNHPTGKCFSTEMKEVLDKYKE